MSVPKHPSVRSRARDAKRSGPFRVLSSTAKRPVPPWPLAAEVGPRALLEVNKDRMGRLQVEIEATKDGRTRGRLKRQLAQLEIATAKLSLETEQTADAELALWSELWRMPQAALWIESHSQRLVALYARTFIRAAAGDLKALTQVRLLGQDLGTSPLALLRLRAEVERVEEANRQGAERRAAKKAAAKKKPDDPRSFLAVVPPPR